METIQLHIFPTFYFFYAEADQHENVRQAIVSKRRGFTSVVEHTLSLFDWLLECFATNIQGIDHYAQRAHEVGEVSRYFLILVQSPFIFNNFYLKRNIIKRCTFPIITYFLFIP